MVYILSNQTNRIINNLIKFSPAYHSFYKELNISQFKSEKDLSYINSMKLQKYIKFCYNYVPYYTDLFNCLKLKPENICCLDDLKMLPLMDKKEVNNNFDKLISKKAWKLLHTSAETSGTTGTPSKFLRDYSSIAFERAAVNRFRTWLGCKNLKALILRGDVILPINKTAPPFWKQHSFDKELVMSSYHLSNSTFEYFRNKIDAFKPEVIYAFPSVVYQLASLYNERGLEGPKLKMILTSSENLTSRHINCIEKVFDCNIRDWYGQVERVAAIGQCENGVYHVLEDYSIVELLDTPYGKEIVGTPLNNFIMPLIRYRTHDIVKVSEQKCPCGRSFRAVSQIFGRSVNYIQTPEGNSISFFLVSDCIDYENNLKEVQFIHPEKGVLILNYIRKDEFTIQNKETLISNLKQHTSPDMKIILNEVDHILKGPNFKANDLITNITNFNSNL